MKQREVRPTAGITDSSSPGDGEEKVPFCIEDYGNHFALSGMNSGCSNAMLGKVCIVAFLVQEQGSAWKDRDLDAIVQVLKKATELIKAQSGLSDNKLAMSYAYDKVSVQLKYDRKNYPQVERDVLEQYGHQSAAQYQEHYEKKFSKDEAPVVFIFNKDFRSFAGKSSERDSSDDEWSFVAYSGNVERCVVTLVHELLHQFGAIDYYYPERVKEVAEKLFPDSIMLHGSTIDPLTRYLIGWDEEIDEKAAEFLMATKNVTEEEIRMARIRDRDNDW